MEQLFYKFGGFWVLRLQLQLDPLEEEGLLMSWVLQCRCVVVLGVGETPRDNL